MKFSNTGVRDRIELASPQNQLGIVVEGIFYGVLCIKKGGWRGLELSLGHRGHLWLLALGFLLEALRSDDVVYSEDHARGFRG